MMLNRFYYMNAAELMDRSFEVYKKSFWLQFAFSIVVNILAGVATFVLVLVLLIGAGVSSALVDKLPVAWIAALVIFVVALVIIWQTMLEAGNIIISKQAFYEEKIDIGRALSSAFKAIPRLFTVVLAETLAAILPTALLCAVVFVASQAFGLRSLDDLSRFAPRLLTFPVILFIFLILLAFLLVFVVMFTFFSAAVPAAIFEKRFFFGALNQSIRLIKEDFWKILGIRMIWSVIVYALYYSLLLAFTLLSGALTWISSSADSTPYLFISALTAAQYASSIFFNVAVAPFAGIITSVIYFNQKIKHDGLDIEIGLEKLSEALERG